MATAKKTKPTPRVTRVANTSLSSKLFSHWKAVLFVLVFAAIGAFVILRSGASTVIVSNFEAETMTLPDGAYNHADSNSSAGASLLLTQSGTASKVLVTSMPVDNVTVNIKGSQCEGSPTVQLSIDGKVVINTVAVQSRTYIPLTGPVTLSAGSHLVELTGANINKVSSTCSRALYVDNLTFSGQVLPPTLSMTSNPASITKGDKSVLSWTSVNATACTASGSWTGNKPSGGSETVTPLADSTYTMTCTNLGGSISASAVVKVAQPLYLSGKAIPTGNVTSGGHTWRQIFAEDFTKDAPLGSWGSECDNNKVTYTGTTGTQWHAYPKCYVDSRQKRPYRSDQVLSVHDGGLDFWLHTVDGKPAGAAPSPLIANGSQYQTYGRYDVRIKQTTMNLSDYYLVYLLWPEQAGAFQCGESDFPETTMSATYVKAFSHYGCAGAKNTFQKSLDKTQWHTFTQEWTPSARSYYIDGVLIGSSPNQVYAKPERWQLQTETNTTCDTTSTCTQEGHVLVDWAVVYAY